MSINKCLEDKMKQSGPDCRANHSMSEHLLNVSRSRQFLSINMHSSILKSFWNHPPNTIWSSASLELSLVLVKTTCGLANFSWGTFSYRKRLNEKRNHDQPSFTAVVKTFKTISAFRRRYACFERGWGWGIMHPGTTPCFMRWLLWVTTVKGRVPSVRNRLNCQSIKIDINR